MKNKTKHNPKFKDSFFNAAKGVIYALRFERNFRIHLIIAIIIIISSLFFNLTRTEIVILIVVITMVMVTELFNTAAERMTDLITEEHHPMAKIVKDMMAGAVLLSCLGATAAGYIIFIRPEVKDVLGESIVLRRIADFPPYVAALAVFVVFSVSVAAKIRRRGKFSLSGGMPSIHSAVAFSLVTVAYSVSSSLNILFLTFLLALMVAQTRVSAGIHTIWEVFAGAIVGSGLTVLILHVVL
ncbi:MAG: diacylglycerol kinase [Elusimicrobiota bacterium]